MTIVVVSPFHTSPIFLYTLFFVGSLIRFGLSPRRPPGAGEQEVVTKKEETLRIQERIRAEKEAAEGGGDVVGQLEAHGLSGVYGTETRVFS